MTVFTELDDCRNRGELVFKQAYDGVDLSGRNLEGLRAERVSFCRGRLERLVLTKASLLLVDFTDADLREITADGARVFRCTLDGTDLRGARLPRALVEECSASNAVFDEAELTRASLAKLSAPGASFRKVSARGSDFSGAQLEGASFAGAMLADADFSEANLRGVDFSGADLSGAWLARADLRGAKVEGANFERADLEGARWLVQPTPEQEIAENFATIEQALGVLEQKVYGAQTASSTSSGQPADPAGQETASSNQTKANQDVTWRFDCGSENAPDNPWGMDSFVFTPDLRFTFDNRRFGVARRGTITKSTHDSLLQWMQESGFPHVPDFEWIPGGDYYRLTRESPQGEEFVVIRRSAVDDFPGYGPLCVALDEWASVMREPERTDAPPGFTYDIRYSDSEED